MSGNIIAITGGPRTGKSTLVEILAEELDAEPFFEGEMDDFPERIADYIRNVKSLEKPEPLEFMLWSRNKYAQDYLEALEVKESGGTAVLDTFYATNYIYIQDLVEDDFENDLITRATEIDMGMFPWPDLVLSLFADKETIKNLAEEGGREFEQNEEFFEEQVKFNEAHQEYFRSLDKPNIEFIDRSGLDFRKPQDLSEVLQVIDEHE